MKKQFYLALLVASGFAAGSAFAAGWEIDQAHTKVGFEASHMIISTVDGQFTSYTSTVNWDGKDVSTLTFEATIDAASVTTANEKRDGHLKSDDFFDVANHPTITFKSTKVEPVSPGKFKVTGDLTIRGVTKSVVLDGSGLDKQIDTPWGFKKTAAKLSGEINRLDFGLKWDAKFGAGELVAGEMVHLDIVAELNEKKD